MRRAILTAVVTAVLALAALGAVVFLEGLHAYRTATTPTPTPNQEPRP